MTEQEAEDTVQSIQDKLTILQNSNSSPDHILNISFHLITRIEFVGMELCMLSNKMRKLRADALERQYLADKS